jgi:hypothetical protein
MDAYILGIDMQNCKNLTSSFILRAASLALFGQIITTVASATTSAWSVDLTFDAYSGLPGGFANSATTPVTLRNQSAPGSVEHHYDVVQPATGVGGQPGYAAGQDGISDLTIRTTLIDGSSGRWAGVAAELRRGGLRMNSVVDPYSSKQGDYAMVAYEVTFASALGVSADQLALRLSSTNGSTQLYEWALVTAGGMGDAPFNPAQIATYNSSIYSQGTPQLSGSGSMLETGRSISQYLSGAPAQSGPSGGLVSNGWWAIDDFNTRIPNGAEELGVSGGDGRIDDNQTVTGGMLGLAGQPMSSFTVWLGLHEVAFDTDGDGFTPTEASPQATFAGMSFGANLNVIPEPGAGLLVLAAAGIFLRRKR